MTNPAKLTSICPVFIANDVKATAKYYVEVLGFSYAHHFDKIENFATLYRDEIEIVVVQRQRGVIEANQVRYGAGYDAYIDPDTLEGVNLLYQEFKTKGVKLLDEPHITDYGSLEFSFEDCDGRIIGVGLIAQNETFFKESNFLS